MAPDSAPMDPAWLGNTINPGGGALGLADVDMKPLDRNRFACMARACRVCDGSLRKCNRSAFMMVCSTLCWFSEHGDAVRACPNLIRMCF